MSNERSPRAVCSTTMGMSGAMTPPWYSATDELRDDSATSELRIKGGAMADSVTRETILDVDSDDAWRAVTEPGQLEQWLAHGAGNHRFEGEHLAVCLADHRDRE